MAQIINQLTKFQRQSPSQSPGGFIRSSSTSWNQQKSDGLCLLSPEDWRPSHQMQPPMPVGGKRLGHSFLATKIAGHFPSRLFLKDKTSGYHFLVNTDAEVSILPPFGADWKHKQDLGMRAVNGSPITTYGTQSLTLDLELQVFCWVFIIADISTPIIGADFLREFGLLVNLKQGCLLDAFWTPLLCCNPELTLPT